MGTSTPNWVWFLDQDLVESCLRADSGSPELARRAATHPAVVEAVRLHIGGDTAGAAQALEPALALNNSDALLLAGQLAFESGEFSDAASYFGKLALAQPDHPYASYNQAVSLGRCRDFPAALQALQRAVVLDPTRPHAWFVLAVCLLHAGRPAESRSAFRHSLDLRPNYAPALFGEAAALQLEGKPSDALGLYNQLLDSQPHQEAILENALSAAIAIQDRSAVRRYAEQLQGVNATSVPALAALAVSCLDEQQTGRATRWLSALAEAQPDSFEGWFNLGVAFAHQSDWTRAARAFETALRLQPEDPQALDGCSQAWMELGETEKAGTLCRQLLSLTPMPGAPVLTNAWFRLGLISFSSGDPENAAEAFRQVLEKEPLWVEAWCNLAICLEGCGRLEDATQAWLRVVQTDPERREAHLALARLWLLLNEPEQAEKHYESSGSADSEVCFHLGVLHQKCDRKEQAKHWYERALEADPKNAYAHWNLGHALFEVGGTKAGNEAAAHHWRQAVELDPGIVRR